MDEKLAQHLMDKINGYGSASHQAARKGNHEQADELWRKMLDTLGELYRHMGLK